ncbi:hypothetical protein CCE28_21365 [Anaeromicrobium sediminis]|uniref:Uncharacterized protein n=1 Tax=Anaeromicrobium sediminis TaxID=1478221 RepID=A0A267M8W4_9FIRM|nr:hypothetical protein CCE28_21365 [Anaeromicrobium sediminis]
MVLVFLGIVLLNLKIFLIIDDRYHIKERILPRAIIFRFIIAIVLCTIIISTADSFITKKWLFYGVHSFAFALLVFIITELNR